MLVPDGFVRRVDRSGVGILRYDVARTELAEFWTAGESLPTAAGRGAVGRARIGGVEVVLRDYRRGGLLRHLLPDLFTSTRRACRELEVAVSLARLGVRTIDPVAVVARARGPLWQLRIATRFLPDATTLPDFVADHPASRHDAVRAAGILVGRAFAAGLLHPDLHPANLLLQEGDGIEATLIDLDRARLVAQLAGDRRDAMLVRMARWLRRHAGELRVRPSRTDHLRLLAGMGLARTERRNAWARLDVKLRAALARRGL